MAWFVQPLVQLGTSLLDWANDSRNPYRDTEKAVAGNPGGVSTGGLQAPQSSGFQFQPLAPTPQAQMQAEMPAEESNIEAAKRRALAKFLK
jgi:hypothetical protein